MTAPEPLRASRLREQVRLLVPQETPNGRGGRVTVFADGPLFWAEVWALRGDEALSQGIQRGVQLWRVTAWARGDVTVQHRLRWKGMEMNIRTAAPTLLRDGLVITAESGGL